MPLFDLSHNLGTLVAPVRERGLKCYQKNYQQRTRLVAPVRERGLKLKVLVSIALFPRVAPVRERGLKWYIQISGFRPGTGRSREGAWIEIPLFFIFAYRGHYGRSREGAWIEMHSPGAGLVRSAVAPVRERGLK